MEKKTIRRLRNQIAYFKYKLDYFDKLLMEEISNTKNSGITCKKCGLKNIRMRQKTGTYFCRSCGYDSRRKR